MADEPAAAERLLDALRRRGVASARELSEALGLSQPSVSRALAATASRVARIGQARRSRYAPVRDVRGLATHGPLYRIDTRGQPHAFGQRTALYGAGCLVAAATPPDWLQGESAEGLLPGLPWFLDDPCPQGFTQIPVGQGFPRRYGAHHAVGSFMETRAHHAPR